MGELTDIKLIHMAHCTCKMYDRVLLMLLTLTAGETEGPSKDQVTAVVQQCNQDEGKSPQTSR